MQIPQWLVATELFSSYRNLGVRGERSQNSYGSL